MSRVKFNFFRPELAHEAFMQKRVAEFISHYGQNITSMNIETLAMSCYSQGVEDCLQLFNRVPIEKPEPMDFQI